MGWADELKQLFEQSGGAGTAQAPAVPNPAETFHRAAQQAPQDVVKDGLAEAFRSNQTPSFAEMVSTLFANSNPEQKAGLLQRLLGVAGPYAANGPIEKVFGSKFPKGVQQVSPAEASQVSPDEVKRLAAHAQNEKESIVDEIAGFYSQHPQVVTALGGLALSVAIQHMARRA